MSNSDLKLYYFNLRARAELIRLIFAASGRAYENITFGFPEWPEYKPKMLLGQVPVLELSDGTQIPQSLTIARYVAREVGMGGKDNVESAKIDAVVDTQRDVNEIFYKQIFFEKDETKKAAELEKFWSDSFVKHVSNLHKLKKAYSKNSKYFVGDKLTWADLYVFQSVDELSRAIPEAKEKFSDEIKSLIETVHNDSKLKKYLDERPPADF